MECRHTAEYLCALECVYLYGRIFSEISATYLPAMAIKNAVHTHLTLAFLSACRHHHVQMASNIRQCIELIPLLSYYIVKQFEVLQLVKSSSLRSVSDVVRFERKVKGLALAWIAVAMPDVSSHLRDTKKAINESSAHASITFTAINFKTIVEGKIYGASVFDHTNALSQRGDLMAIAHAALLACEAGYQVNNMHQVFKINDVNIERFNILLSWQQSMQSKVDQEMDDHLANSGKSF